MSAAAVAPGARLGGPLGASVVLHAAALVGIFTLTSRPPAASPPIYKVDIVAAPPGPRAEGIVTPLPPAPAPPKANVTTPEAPPAPPPPRPAVLPSPSKSMPAPPKAKVPPAVKPRRVTQSTPAPTTKQPPATPQPKAPPPEAGGGPTGGKGADVATVRTAGIEFPYPGYLNNIVRQVALNFAPDNSNSELRAEVAFLIRRDGSVAGFRFTKRSGDYGFDLEAQGAIEKASPNFGALPDGFSDDVLPVIFSFDPRLLH